MPVNEIHAPIYIKGKLATPAYPAGHAFRLYFLIGCTWLTGVSGDEENWRIALAGSPVGGSVQSLIDNLFDRAEPVIPSGSSVKQIELWESHAGANTLVHLNPLPEGNSYGGSSSHVASSYTMLVFGTALRPQFKFTMFDGGTGDPQGSTAAQPPDTDDGGLGWLFLKSNYPLANNDGERLTRIVSVNTGYNRKLARSYGRSVTP